MKDEYHEEPPYRTDKAFILEVVEKDLKKELKANTFVFF